MCAAMAMVCRSGGQDFHISGHEHIPELVQLSHYNMSKSPKCKALMDSGCVDIITADGLKLKEHASGRLYHAINCGAAAKSEEAAMGMVDCLHMNGRLICPVAPPNSLQCLTSFDKTPNG